MAQVDTDEAVLHAEDQEGPMDLSQRSVRETRRVPPREEMRGDRLPRAAALGAR